MPGNTRAAAASLLLAASTGALLASCATKAQTGAAANYLVAQGVSRNRVATRGMGEAEPAAPNDTEAGRQQNRRVAVAIYASEAYRAEVARRAQQ